MEWTVEPEGFTWVAEQVADFFAHQVTSLVPAGFEAYARILHPPGPDPQSSWQEVAAWSGTPPGPSSPFASIATRTHAGDSGQDDSAGGAGTEQWPGAPMIGPLAPEQAAVLVELLRTSTGEGEVCWFGVWEGYGWVHGGGITMSTDPAVHGRRPGPARTNYRCRPTYATERAPTARTAATCSTAVVSTTPWH